MNREDYQLLRLWLTSGIGLSCIHRLVRANLPLADIFDTPAFELAEKFDIAISDANKIVTNRSTAKIERELALAQRYAIKIITYFNPDYPPALKQTYHCPPVLYVRGQIDYEFNYALAVVGTRSATVYGVEHTRSIIDQLAGLEPKISIISGLAIGIDSIAHQQALKHNLKTIAVLANGLATVYPQQNTRLADDILKAGGAVISEVPIDTPPLKRNFPLRNRIISGLARGLLVSEAGLRSGALISARYGLEQNREVFALPGPIDAPSYAGSLKLIKNNQAYLLTSATDIIANMGWGASQRQEQLTGFESKTKASNSPKPAKASAGEKNKPELDLATVGDETQRLIIAELSAGKASLEQICTKLNLPVANALAKLMQLDLAGFVIKDDDGSYRLNQSLKYRHNSG